MNRITLAQLRGAKDLLEDAVLAGTDAAERLQLSMARRPYAALEMILPIAAPVRAVEQVQAAITLGIYGTIRSTTRAAALLAGSVLDLAERT
ncbi:MAG TPA: hypothetical protein VF472_21145 [Burkholderiaceae bacterium]